MNPNRKGNSHEIVTPSLLCLSLTKAPDLPPAYNFALQKMNSCSCRSSAPLITQFFIGGGSFIFNIALETLNSFLVSRAS